MLSTDTRVRIAEKIQAAMAAKNIKVYGIAKQLNVSNENVNDVVKGKTNYRIESLVRVLGVLGLELEVK